MSVNTRSIPSPYVNVKLNKRINMQDRLKELEDELESTQDIVDDIEDEIDNLESMLDEAQSHTYSSIDLAIRELDRELSKTNLVKYINANKLKNIIDNFLSIEDMVVPQSVFLGLSQSIDDKASFEKLFDIYTKFHNTIVSSKDYQDRVKMSIELEKKNGLNTLKEGDILMSVFNSGSIISDYFKGVNKMKESDFKSALIIFEDVLQRFLSEKTLFTDVFRLFANLGVCRVSEGDFTGFIALDMSSLLKPDYQFAKKQKSILKQHYADLYKDHLKYKKDKITTKISPKNIIKNNKSFIYIPTVLERYYLFIQKLDIDFSGK
jgi:hypothetical protein